MAVMQTLLKSLEETTSYKIKALEHIVSQCRKAGDLPPSKRGFGAAPVTVRDAANLLIATFATASPSEIVPEPGRASIVAQFRSLRASLPFGAMQKATPEILSISTAPDFGAALELLIENTPAIVMRIGMAITEDHQSKEIPSIAFNDFLTSSRLTFSRPKPHAEINLVESDAQDEIPLFALDFYWDHDLRQKGFYASADVDDRTLRSISLKTLLNLSAAVLGRDEEAERLG
ncbi:hypothetical protein [Roseomonas mucosa]